jgi:hypothetical protein
MFWFAARNWSGEQERAAVKDQGIARKVERRRRIAASATDSVQAGAELQYIIPVGGWLVGAGGRMKGYVGGGLVGEGKLSVWAGQTKWGAKRKRMRPACDHCKM